jgi:hypothetical protein
MTFGMDFADLWHSTVPFRLTSRIRGEHFQFSNDEIAARYDDIFTVTEIAASSIATQYNLQLVIDANLLSQAVNATYDELAKVRSYHLAHTDRSSASRTGAYTAIWLSRFKPIRLNSEIKLTDLSGSDTQELAMRVNEIVGVNIAFAQMGLSQSALENREAVELIEYVSRRDADPVGLALMLKILHRKSALSRPVD